jgi:hypothetical protein
MIIAYSCPARHKTHGGTCVWWSGAVSVAKATLNSDQFAKMVLTEAGAR